MNTMIKKLTSRKLWLSVAGVATGIAMALGVDGGDISTVAGAVTALVSIVAYIVMEGKIDEASVGQTIEAAQEVVETIEGES